MAVLLYMVWSLFLIFVCGIITRLSHDRINSREPPIVASSIPLVGHLVGLVQHGGAYYAKVSAVHSLPIFTLKILRSKIYVIDSLELIAAVGRNPKIISFVPYVKVAAQRLSGLGHAALECFDDSPQRTGLSAESVRSLEYALGSAAGAEELGNSLLHSLESLLKEPDSTSDQPRKLLGWIQQVVTRSSSTAVYGPQNPLLEVAIEEEFWTFEHNMGILLIGFLPAFFKRKAIRARDKVSQAFVKYYTNQGLRDGSSIARARYDPPAKHGLNVEEISRLEVTFLIALLNNTVASAFWTIYHVFSSTSLLSELRSELQNAVLIEEGVSVNFISIDISQIKQECPLLFSTYQEVLRIHTIRPITRKVLSDVVLNERYFLEKDSTVQMSTRSLHEDTAVWGPSARDADFCRFMHKDRKKLPALAFGSFGSAPSICPGRQIATLQILSIAAWMILRFDVEPTAGGFQRLEQDQKSFATVTKPLSDVEVVMRQRDGWQGRYNFQLGDPRVKFNLACG